MAFLRILFSASSAGFPAAIPDLDSDRDTSANRVGTLHNIPYPDLVTEIQIGNTNAPV